MNEIIHPVEYASLEGRINFESGNSVVFASNENATGSIVTYESENRIIRLNDLLPQGWVFRPTDDRFSAHLQQGGRIAVTAPYPEVQFNVKALQKDERKVLYILHEIGHALDNTEYAFSIQTDHQVNYKKLYNEEQAFTKFLIKAHYARKKECWKADENYERITERNAWVIALRLKRQLNILSDFKGKALRRFYHDCLNGYAADTSKSRWERDPPYNIVPEEYQPKCQ